MSASTDTEALYASFSVDSSSYEILQDAAESISDVPGLTMEIGVRAGGSSQMIIDGLLKNNKGMRTHVTIDPYGLLPYIYQEKSTIEWGCYSNEERDRAIPGLFLYCANTLVNFVYFQLTDTQFFKRFADGVPIYVDHKEEVINQYALVFFDGPHSLETIMAETVFFAERASPGAIFVYDDVTDEFYDHVKILDYLLLNGWQPRKSSRVKASYEKVLA